MTTKNKFTTGAVCGLLAAAALLLPQPLPALSNGRGQEVFTFPSVFNASATLKLGLEVRNESAGDMQYWRDVGGVVVATMTGSGILISSGFRGDGSGLTGVATHTFRLGDTYGGGKVFMIDPSGRQVLIAAMNDLGLQYAWSPVQQQTNARQRGVYAGKANTVIISTMTGAGSYAARACADYTYSDGMAFYDDWYLPSAEELNLLYDNGGVVGNLSPVEYWSSTESDSSPGSNAKVKNFSTSANYDVSKTATRNVRCVRAGPSLDSSVIPDQGLFAGETYGGGLVVWADAKRLQALIAAPGDVSNSPWSPDIPAQAIGALRNDKFAGAANTVLISTTYGRADYAARRCEDYSVTTAGGEYYDDWYLPSRDELQLLFNYKTQLGMGANAYWSSSESDSIYAFYVDFNSGSFFTGSKLNNFFVRCVRAAPAAPAGNARYADYVRDGVGLSSTQTFTGANTFRNVSVSSFSVGVATFTAYYGKVGIGTALPAAKLEIRSTIPQDGPALLVSTGAAASLVVSSYGAVGIGLPSPSSTSVLEVYKEVKDNVWGQRDFPKGASGGIYLAGQIENDDVAMGGHFTARAWSDVTGGYIIALNAEAERTEFGGTGTGVLQGAAGLRVGNFRNYAGGAGRVVNTYGILVDSQTAGSQDNVYTIFSADAKAPAYFNGPVAAATYRIGVSTVLVNNSSGLRLGFVDEAYGGPPDWMTTALGNNAGLYNTGNGNVFVGGEAGRSNLTGGRNVYIGAVSGMYTEVGGDNVAVGYGAAGSNTGTGESFSSGTVIGALAGASLLSGAHENTLIGQRAGFSLGNGARNTIIGAGAGENLISGDRNIIIGSGRSALASSVSDFLDIGGTVFGNLFNGNLAVGAPEYLSPDRKFTAKGAFSVMADVVGASITVSNAQDGYNITGVHAVAFSSYTPANLYGGYFVSSGTVGGYAYGLYAEVISPSPDNVGVYGKGETGLFGEGALYGVNASNSNSLGRALNLYQGNAAGHSIYAAGGKNYLEGMTGVGVNPGDAMLQVQGVAANAYSLAVSTGFAYHLVVSTNGMVGIGTASPAAGLDVAAPARLAKPLTKADNTGRNLTGSDFGRTLVVDNASAQIFYLPAASSVDVGATVTFVKLNTGKLTIQAQGGNYVGASASGGGIYNDAVTPPDAAVTLRLVTATKWAVISGQGAWISY